MNEPVEELTIAEAAERYGVNRRTLQKATERGDIPARHLARGETRAGGNPRHDPVRAEDTPVVAIEINSVTLADASSLNAATPAWPGQYQRFLHGAAIRTILEWKIAARAGFREWTPLVAAPGHGRPRA